MSMRKYNRHLTLPQMWSNARAIARIARQAHRLYQTTQIKHEPRQVTQPLTGQFDFKTDYLKRRVPRRKRKFIRKRRRFNRRIIRTIRNANTGTTHLVRRSVFKKDTANNVSGTNGYGLYSFDGFNGNDTNDTHNDISEFLKEKDPTGWINWNSGSIPDYKLWCMHGSMEVTIRNIGSNDAIVEAYYLRGKYPVNAAFADSTGALYTKGFAVQPTAQDPDTGNLYDGPLSESAIGTTPFQSSLFCRYMRIYKRQKFRIPPGNEINVVLHVGSATFSPSQVKGKLLDKRYHGVLFQQQGGPFHDGTNPQAAQSTSLMYMCVRRYRVKFLPNNFPTDAFEVGST